MVLFVQYVANLSSGEHFNKEYGENIARIKGKFRKQKRRNIGYRHNWKHYKTKRTKMLRDRLNLEKKVYFFCARVKKGKKQKKVFI